MPDTLSINRRYSWKLYPTDEQAAELRRQCKMMAELWNALLARHETIYQRTVQRQIWYDAGGKRHVGESIHSLTYETIRYARGEQATVLPGKNGRPRPFTLYDMQNEVTYLMNELPEWRALSCWSALRTAQLLDLAFQAFYSRAKQGAGAESGYPKYKRSYNYSSIPHRFASGCKLTPSSRHRRSWELRLKGVPGTIHARGMLPAPVEKFANADIIWRDGNWWLSAGVRIEQRRQSRRALDYTVEFGAIDGSVLVNGSPEWPEGRDQSAKIGQLAALQDVLGHLIGERDRRWPPKQKRPVEEEAIYQDAQRDIVQLQTNIRRRRLNALHAWSAALVSEARSLRILLPPIQKNTKSGKGDAKEWGGAVETVALINRQVLCHAPAMAAATLRYKAEEAGVPCVVETVAEPEIVLGADLKSGAQTVRRSARAARLKAPGQKRAA